MVSSPSWTKGEIQRHTRAAKSLGDIKTEVAKYITQKGTSLFESDVLRFIKSSYKKHGLVNDHKKEFAIVAFGKNTSEVHYFPKGKGVKLKPNTLILLDMWARSSENGSPYADMTWMFWYGSKVPADIQKKWNVLVLSRTKAVTEIEKYLKKNTLPRGLDIDRASHDVIGHAKYGSSIKHTIGHSLGFNHPHGKLPGINWREYSPLSKNIGYTIEPGMYLKDHGFRTEIDFYISNQNKVVITTPMEQELEII
ncbi:MAG: M24 family metallopeptidase [Candidatus Paceibacterota bacterium]|jgi:Xaa-Pro aminopeptidase